MTANKEWLRVCQCQRNNRPKRQRTRDGAIQECIRLARKIGWLYPEHEFTAYYCEFCKTWHNGKRVKGKRQTAAFHQSVIAPDILLLTFRYRSIIRYRPLEEKLG